MAGALALLVSHPQDAWEDVITSDQHVPSEQTVQTLREQLNQDSQLLASLDPKSATYARLAARIERRTAELLDCEEQREHRQRAAQQALAEQRRRQTESSERAGGLGFVVVGGLITYTGWGSWWPLLGVFLVIVGVTGLVSKSS